MTDANGKNYRQFKHNLRPRKFADVQVLTLSRRKQGFESPRERHVICSVLYFQNLSGLFV